MIKELDTNDKHKFKEYIMFLFGTWAWPIKTHAETKNGKSKFQWKYKNSTSTSKNKITWNKWGKNSMNWFPQWPNSCLPSLKYTSLSLLFHTEHAGSRLLWKTTISHVMSSPKNWMSIIINYSSAQQNFVSQSFTVPINAQYIYIYIYIYIL